MLSAPRRVRADRPRRGQVGLCHLQSGAASSAAAAAVTAPSRHRTEAPDGRTVHERSSERAELHTHTRGTGRLTWAVAALAEPCGALKGCPSYRQGRDQTAQVVLDRGA